MARNWKFPIRYKFLLVLSAVVCAAVAVYLYLASKIFYEDKTLLVYELNQNNVRITAKELDVFLAGVLNQERLFAELGSQKNQNNGQNSAEKEKNSSSGGLYNGLRDENVVELRVYDAAGKKMDAQAWPDSLRPYTLSAADADKIFEDGGVALPSAALEALRKDGVQLRSVSNPPLLLVRRWMNPGVAVSGLFRTDSVVSAMNTGGIARIYALAPDGELLFGDRENGAGADPLYEASKVGQLRSEVRRFEIGGKQYLGSWYRAQAVPVVVASRVEVGAAFAAARVLIRKSLIYAAIIVTSAFLIALLFSHSLTDPIYKMLEATYRVAKGDFDSLIHVKTHDELAVLAASFNTMTVDLRASRSQIEEYSRDLEKKVVDRTMKLETQNVAIREAQEALIRTTRLASVGEVAGRAAHEVLNPLTNISARLEKNQLRLKEKERADFKMLEEILGAWKKSLEEKGLNGFIEELSKNSTAYPGKKMLDEDLINLDQVMESFRADTARWGADVDFLLNESARISKIVNGMRSLTRVSGNRKKVDLHQVAQDAFNASHDVLSKNGIAYEVTGAVNSCFVFADRDELLQVVTNLVRNSMQAMLQNAATAGMATGKIWIQVSRAEADGRARCQLRVCDNGPGIAPERFEEIFEASFTTKTPDEGTGLGLSIARRFVRSYEGELRVEKSEPGAETVFLADLPAYTGEEGSLDGTA